MTLENQKEFYEELSEICLKYQVMIFTGKTTKNSFIDTINYC